MLMNAAGAAGTGRVDRTLFMARAARAIFAKAPTASFNHERQSEGPAAHDGVYVHLVVIDEDSNLRRIPGGTELHRVPRVNRRSDFWQTKAGGECSETSHVSPASW